MKKGLILLMLISAGSLTATAQTIVGDRGYFRDSVYINGVWVTKVDADSTMGDGSDNVLPTQGAVKGAIGYAVDSLADSLYSRHEVDSVAAKRASDSVAAHPDTNLGGADLTLTSNRTLNLNNKNLLITSPLDGEVWFSNTPDTSFGLHIGRGMADGSGTKIFTQDANYFIEVDQNGDILINGRNVTSVKADAILGKLTSSHNGATANQIVDATSKVSDMIHDSIAPIQTNFIKNGTSAQTADFNISGSGTIGGYLMLNSTRVWSGAGTGLYNIGVGPYSLDNNTTGERNIGMGFQTLWNNTSGSYNVMFGIHTGSANTTGSNNIGLGQEALYFNETGSGNVAIGSGAADYLNGGDGNVAIGNSAMNSGRTDPFTTGDNNVAIGVTSLNNLTSGSDNIAIGRFAGGYISGGITAGQKNITIGYISMASNVTGSSNIAIGGNTFGSLTTGENNIAIGQQAAQFNQTGSRNIMIGNRAGIVYGDTTISDALLIGNRTDVSRMDELTVIGDLATGSLRFPHYKSSSTDTVMSVDSDGTLKLINKAVATIDSITATSDTLSLSDLGHFVLANNGGDMSISIPDNADVAFPVGAQIYVTQAGSGYVTFVPLTGVTLHSSTGNYQTRTQYSTCELIKTDTDEWTLFGDIR